MPSIDVTQVEYHRNGVGGEPFYAIRFTCEENGPMLATVFPPQGRQLELAKAGNFFNPMVAVYQIDRLPTIDFGHNSWRGDIYAPALFAAIDAAGYGPWGAGS